MAQPAQKLLTVVNAIPRDSSQALVKGELSPEIVFGVVGHIGSGTSLVAHQLESKLKADGYSTHLLKARLAISEWAEANRLDSPKVKADERPSLDDVKRMQDLGDQMRRANNDYAAIAKSLVGKIREGRARDTQVSIEKGKTVVPDDKKRAFILDSIRHPAEVELLRQVYKHSFVLVGVVCEENARMRRISQKFDNAGDNAALKLMDRDAKAIEAWGQRVSDSFYRSDVFLDNSEARHDSNNNPNVNWTLADQLERVLNILSNKTIVRPTKDETAMYIANGARFRSACLSRQVGAALSDRSGSVISTGTNEVPKAGGGLYTGSADSDPDHRCAYTSIHGGDKFCSNTREQKTIANDLLAALETFLPTESDKDALAATILTSRIGGLIEFSRAVHAEMDALLSAGRSRAGTIGSRLHVTTFPCHFCARHIVAAGVDEVQYIEPYPKSKALELHRDAITTTATGWKAPSEGGSHVLFRPFTGIAPRLYGRAFSKEFELKDSDGNLAIGVPVWGDAWGSLRVSYAELEAALDR